MKLNPICKAKAHFLSARGACPLDPAALSADEGEAVQVSVSHDKSISPLAENIKPAVADLRLCVKDDNDTSCCGCDGAILPEEAEEDIAGAVTAESTRELSTNKDD